MARAPATEATASLRAALVAAAIVFVAASNLTPISESDFWIQLEVGDRIRATGTIPRTIEFAFTEGREQEFVAHEWLPSALSSAVHARVGYGGMIVFKCALALCVVGLVFGLAHRINGNLTASVLIAGAVATAMNFRFQMRPEIFAFLLALASLHLLVAFRVSGRWPWLLGLPPVALIWANAHGSFVLNLALPWMFLAGSVLDEARGRSLFDPATRRENLRTVWAPLVAAGVVVLAVSLANPYGVRLLTHAVSFSGADWLRDHIVEFGSTFDPRVRSQTYFRVYAAFVVAAALTLVAARRRLDGTSLVLLAAFGWMSIDAIRFTAWLALAATYPLARALADLGRGHAVGRRVALAGIVAFVAGTGIVAARGDVRGHRIGFRNEAPIGEAALAFLRDVNLEGNVFNTFSHGDQIVHAFYPKARVVIDSRIDAYGEAYYLRYLSMCGRSYRALGRPEDLLAFLDRYEVNTIVTRPLDFQNWSDKGHLDALSRAGWNVLFTDPGTIVMRRDVRPGRP